MALCRAERRGTGLFGCVRKIDPLGVHRRLSKKPLGIDLSGSLFAGLSAELHANCRRTGPRPASDVC